ncbi:hypothetical protein DFH07DRAFT_782702 [Mycena maculata]|uniref:F-box domain-containing protein n=1 Tax=Mycena maculata TaxID=230809 RepID=A0AAD7MPN9_9AGAR|nr:hypothetical protein DFH07DRAFT_782702 [Mycena maculata]
MAKRSTLTTIPTDLQYHLLSILPHFYDLGALILTARCFHDIYKPRRKPLLDAVGRNFLGCLFDEALLLARTQESAYELGDASVEGFSSVTVLLVINNDYIANSLEPVVFRLLKADASEFEFWRFCLQSRKTTTKFLKTIPQNELLELSHFVKGISNLIYAMRGVPHQSDHNWDFISSVLSTGPENILRLWDACQDGSPDFCTELNIAGGHQEEGFFTYPLFDAMEEEIVGLLGLEPIFDLDNEKVNVALFKVEADDPTSLPDAVRTKWFTAQTARTPLYLMLPLHTFSVLFSSPIFVIGNRSMIGLILRKAAKSNIFTTVGQG